jgi:hypothetical protein
MFALNAHTIYARGSEVDPIVWTKKRLSLDREAG